MPSKTVIFVLVLFAVTAPAGAQSLAGESSGTPDASSTPSHAASEQPLMTRDYLFGDWLGLRNDMQAYGVTFRPDWTGEVFGNPSGGARQGIISDGVFDLPLEIDLNPLTHGAVRDTLFHASAFYIYGPNLSSSFVHDFSVTSNLAGYNTLRLDELWLQKGLWDNFVTVKVGNLVVDNEYFQSASSALFISSPFGSFTLLANNLPDAPVYPLASPGVRIHVQPEAHTYVMAGVYGLDNGSLPNVNNQNGTRFALNAASGMLVMSEAGYLVNQGAGDKGLQGTFRLGSFVITGNSPTLESQADAVTKRGPERGAGADFAIYGVADQQVYAQDARGVSLFTRDGGAPTNTNFVDFYAEGGVNLTGFVPGRDHDVAGVAVARSHVSQDYSVAQISEGHRSYSAETLVEATYKVQITPWWNIQPDVQYIVTPSGAAGSHNALVLGLRTYVLF